MIARPQNLSRRWPLAAAALLFAAGNIVFFLVYRANTNERRASLEARRDDLSRSVAAREADAERLATQRERLSGVTEAMEEFYGNRIGTQEQTLAAVVDELHAVLKETGVEANQISYSTTPDTKLPLTRLKINFPVRCDYARFKKLLKGFETSRRWIAVESVAIRRDSEQGGVNVQIELATYFSDRAEDQSSSSGQRTGPAAPAVPTTKVRGAVPASTASKTGSGS
jgi:Tfp pilus assembly protein PilO